MHLPHYLVLLPMLVCAAPTENTECQHQNKAECRNNDTKLVDYKNDQSLPTSGRNINVNESVGTPESNQQGRRRTWRFNHKAIGPILIGVVAKASFFLATILSVLTIMGLGALMTSNVSLFLSFIVFIRRFLGSDHNGGGFFGLNPLGFPHAPLAYQDRYTGTGHRKSIKLIRGRSENIHGGDNFQMTE